MTEVCDCGFEAENSAGLAAHERACDYEEDEQDSEDTLSTPPTVPTRVADAVAERDDYECQRCGDESDLTVHRYREDGADHPRNLVLLCGDCDDYISGGHYHTKRDQVRNGS